MKVVKLKSSSEAETLEIGCRLGSKLKAPTSITLKGELGAGKTTLTRGLAQGLGVSDTSVVHSPSFSLINEYQTESTKIYHIDLYRLDSVRDHYSIGLDEILAEVNCFFIIEWAEKLRFEVQNPIEIEIAVQENQDREFTIRDYVLRLGATDE
jgi:tRNA threonylcarbamoyladenosine biosynthesis protein TsaE